MHIPNFWKLLKGSSKELPPPPNTNSRAFTKRRKVGKTNSERNHGNHGNLHRDMELEIKDLAAGNPEIAVFMKYKLPEFSDVQRYDVEKIQFDPIFRYLRDKCVSVRSYI